MHHRARAIWSIGHPPAPIPRSEAISPVASMTHSGGTCSLRRYKGGPTATTGSRLLDRDLGSTIGRKLAILDLHDHGTSRIRSAWRMTEEDDFGAQAMWRQLQEANCPEAQILVLRKGWTAAVEHHHTLAVFQALLMCVPRHHDIHRHREQLLQLSHGPEAAPEAVDHAESPAMDLHHMQIPAAGILDRIVIA